MGEYNIGDIIKLKDYASSPKYTYLVIGINIEQDMESGKITKEDNYIRLTNLTRLFEGYYENSIISINSVDKILFNIN